MYSITIDELRSKVEGYIEAAKSTKGGNRVECAFRSYKGVPERFKNVYFKLIEDIRNDME